MARYMVAVLTPWLKSVAAVSTASLHRGWGDKIEWYTMNDGLQRAAAENKHMMVIVHLMTCPACVRKKTWFSRSQAIADLSQHFVMVNVQPSEVPRYIKDLAPDGHYVPRILFMTPKGRVLRGIRTNHPEYGYVYMDEHQLVHNMKMLVPTEGN
ncbi:thioredoxin domain-containing protein 12-like [Elysia marginata]|uniref:Thioredoxin domain-containing protein 12-like n=1 Tax=Elysia marginata TaxID=1093978 RepID=A0AAV4ETM4_9GAST|nr:thioredoxin domain-containing protein 12-like [Elysia marginata]